MLKSNLTLQPNRLGEAAINASRQMWLASLGAAVVTRDWVQTEAGGVFKTLVKEGTVVESRAIRFVGDRIENSVSFANSVWKGTRKTVESTVKQAADTAVSIAQQVLPKTLPAFELPGMPKAARAKSVRRAAKVAKKPARANPSTRAKRGRKSATKRG
jgi:poly(hydroxyalkanoate) granule associated protein phasin